MTIWTLRATIGQERAIAKHINKKIETKKLEVYSLLIPESLRGYLFIEAKDIENVDKAVLGIPHLRSRVVGEVDISELESFLVPKPTIEGLHVNDIIEIISGPFKGSRAKINRIDVSREEVTVELLDSQIPIPIKLHSDFCKVIESAAGEHVEEELTMVESATSKEGAEKDKGKKEKEGEEEEEDIFSEFFKT
ncbi:transcription elongation factor Spt5 [Candidatus Heimdallarchaeota archaeon]|nr:MAG: transcription elongation factor Spt5 [Candidatus Gerdarchaeota archaeon]RLI73398.1 MAG: transcription elongation factor Spt5 [Candidatus Heimdallarchaeota archaeon]